MLKTTHHPSRSNAYPNSIMTSDHSRHLHKALDLRCSAWMHGSQLVQTEKICSSFFWIRNIEETPSNIIKYIRNQPGNTWCPRAHIWVQFLLPFPCLNYAETKDRVRVRFALEVAVGKLRYPAKVYIQNNKFINILTRHQDLRIKTVRYWPGSCAPNWLHGNAMIVNPATSLFSSLGLQKSGPLLTRANHLQPTRPV